MHVPINLSKIDSRIWKNLEFWFRISTSKSAFASLKLPNLPRSKDNSPKFRHFETFTLLIQGGFDFNLDFRFPRTHLKCLVITVRVWRSRKLENLVSLKNLVSTFFMILVIFSTNKASFVDIDFIPSFTDFRHFNAVTTYHWQGPIRHFRWQSFFSLSGFQALIAYRRNYFPERSSSIIKISLV